ncbi:MAG TPA: DUF3370 domain-containing protein [Halomicronema sp.]
MLPFLPIVTVAQIIPAPPGRTPAPSPSQPSFPQPTRPKTPPLPPPEVLPPLDELPAMEPIPPQEVVEPTQIRALPGQLDSVPVFNSNSPELVLNEGILLSTFPPNGMRVPEAHLNYPFEGRFDLFSHHIARARTSVELRTLYQGIILYNPNREAITFQVLQGSSYLTSPDALFVELADAIDNPNGTVFSGPGSRVMNDVLRGLRQTNWPATIRIAPGQSVMLMNLPLPLGKIAPVSNGRSTLMRLNSSGPVYVANLAMFAPLNADGSERAPTLDEWQRLLTNGGLAGPRDKRPTPLDDTSGDIVYGRVAGVANGSRWVSEITDDKNVPYLSVPKKGEAISYGLSTLHEITLGTGQIQSAEMLARYPDTAYQAHGNYAIEYNITMPLYNKTDRDQTVRVSISTPLKSDELKDELLYLQPLDRQIFFRGTVRVRYNDEKGISQTRYVHLVQRRGQEGQALATLKMPPGDRRLVQVDFLYPPDATPPQVLTIKSEP